MEASVAADGSGPIDIIGNEQEMEIIYRRPRIFISHVWGRHDDFADKIKKLINEEFTEVDDLSVYETMPETDTNYKSLENLLLKSKIAARIFASDIVIASIDSAVSQSQWVRSELELAAIAYTKPILLVDDSKLNRRTTLRSEIMQVNRNCVEVNLDHPDEIIGAVKKFVPKYVRDAGDIFQTRTRFPSMPINGLDLLKQHSETLDRRSSPEHEKYKQQIALSQDQRMKRRDRRAKRFSV